MLTHAEAQRLIHLDKVIESPAIASFPSSGNRKVLELTSVDGNENFIVDINRPGQIFLSRCTYQNRYRKDIILLRLDINGPKHTNPDGTIIPCPHLHVYREGSMDRWAYPVDPNDFPHLNDMIQTMIDFLEYCHVTNTSEIRSLQGGVFDGTTRY